MPAEPPWVIIGPAGKSAHRAGRIARTLGLMFDLTAAIEAARRSGIDVWTSSPATSAEVDLLERTLGHGLPGSYRRFLLSVGALSVHARQVTGVIDNTPLSLEGSSLYGETLHSQRAQELPPGLLVIQPGDEAPYCLDMRTPSAEAPVVCFEVHSKFIGRVAASFEEWLAKFVF